MAPEHIHAFPSARYTDKMPETSLPASLHRIVMIGVVFSWVPDFFKVFADFRVEILLPTPPQLARVPVPAN
ncbi:MAG: hypothetical protein Fur0021_02770 [Candidatus Promineifilaceae bacterium]